MLIPVGDFNLSSAVNKIIAIESVKEISRNGNDVVFKTWDGNMYAASDMSGRLFNYIINFMEEKNQS